MHWTEPQDLPIPQSLQDAVGGHPLVAQTLVRRGIATTQAARAFLNPDYYTPSPPGELPGLLEAADHLERAIRAKETILVWGDFDVDGQTSTSVLVSGLRGLGGDVRHYIPIRATESHGITLSKLKELLAEGVDVLLTCDTGIDEHNAIDYAQSQGVSVIITDHHDLPPQLPNAAAIVNGNLLPSGHPLANLAGVGVAYKLIEELYRRAERSADSFLDLVALGTVADIVPQTGDNRYLVQRGLPVLQNTSRLGLKALYANAKLNPLHINEEHIGFVIGPRLNALGRLGDANSSVEFLTTPNPGRAQILASQLEGLNKKRQHLTEDIFQSAQGQIERSPALVEDYAALVLFDSSWHPGVIGIVASRLVERYHKPTILLTQSGDNARGSARSIKGVHITKAIAAQANLLDNFGGHPMAAGVSLPLERVPEFRRSLSQTIAQSAGFAPRERSLSIDGYLPFSALSPGLVADLERLAPFGPENPSLTLATRDVKIIHEALIGKDRTHRKLYLQDAEGTNQEVLWWRSADISLPEGKFDLAYSVKTSTYQGQRRVQVTWADARQEEAAKIEVAPALPKLEVIDLRDAPNPLEELENLRERHPHLFVWAEGAEREKIHGEGRSQAKPSNVLAIWTTPPGHAELKAILEMVEPEKMYIFAQSAAANSVEDFLKQLAGLVKHTLNAKGGEANLAALAEATAQRVAVVRSGAEWLEGQGHVQIQSRSDESYHLEAGTGVKTGDHVQRFAILQGKFKETLAYREHFRRAKVGMLVD